MDEDQVTASYYFPIIEFVPFTYLIVNIFKIVQLQSVE